MYNYDKENIIKFFNLKSIKKLLDILSKHNERIYEEFFRGGIGKILINIIVSLYNLDMATTKNDIKDIEIHQKRLKSFDDILFKVL